MDKRIRLTVFTPAYNRAHTLPRTYESLLKQRCKDFLWLIVDDGSVDNTSEIVKQWQLKDNGFDIRYIYKENGGMHTAHNIAYENIDTELNVCIDSDDMLADDAVEIILSLWESVKDKGYAGIMGLDADFEGNIIGSSFPDDVTESTVIGFYANGGSGDKKLVYRTDIIKSTPMYPVYEGEKYVSLSYKYRMIDQTYKMIVTNEVLCNVEYQADGHGASMWKEYVRSPKGFAFFRKFCMQTPTSNKRLIIDCIHYCSSSILAKNKKYISESPRKFLTVLCTIPGWVLSLISKRKAKG